MTVIPPKPAKPIRVRPPRRPTTTETFSVSTPIGLSERMKKAARAEGFDSTSQLVVSILERWLAAYEAEKSARLKAP